MELRYFPALGYIRDTIEASLMPTLLENIKNIETHINDNVEPKLDLRFPRNVEHEYLIKDTKAKEEISNIVLPLVHQHIEIWPDACNTNIRSIYSEDNVGFAIDELWVSFQQEDEVIPPHINNGAYTFLIYVDIPYDRKALRKMNPEYNMLHSYAGDLLFYVSNSNGDQIIHPQFLSSADKGMLVLFPSNITHSEYPFKCTSESNSKYKIAICGTVSIKTDNSIGD